MFVFADFEENFFGGEVVAGGEGADAAFGKGVASGDDELFLGGEFLEIQQGHEMNVGGVVPGMRKGGADGHTPGQGEFKSDAPAAEIGKRNQAATPDTQHFAQDDLRIAQGLEGFFENNDVEESIGEALKAPVEVGLHDGYATRDAGFNGIGIEFDALSAHPFELGEAFEKESFAAAEVEHGDAFRNEVFDPFILPACGGSGGFFRGDAEAVHEVAESFGREVCHGGVESVAEGLTEKFECIFTGRGEGFGHE